MRNIILFLAFFGLADLAYSAEEKKKPRPPSRAGKDPMDLSLDLEGLTPRSQAATPTPRTRASRQAIKQAAKEAEEMARKATEEAIHKTARESREPILHVAVRHAINNPLANKLVEELAGKLPYPAPRNEGKRTALHLAIELNGSKELIEILMPLDPSKVRIGDPEDTQVDEIEVAEAVPYAVGHEDVGILRLLLTYLENAERCWFESKSRRGEKRFSGYRFKEIGVGFLDDALYVWFHASKRKKSQEEKYVQTLIKYGPKGLMEESLQRQIHWRNVEGVRLLLALGADPLRELEVKEGIRKSAVDKAYERKGDSFDVIFRHAVNTRSEPILRAILANASVAQDEVTLKKIATEAPFFAEAFWSQPKFLPMLQVGIHQYLPSMKILAAAFLAQKGQPNSEAAVESFIAKLTPKVKLEPMNEDED